MRLAAVETCNNLVHEQDHAVLAVDQLVVEIRDRDSPRDFLVPEGDFRRGHEDIEFTAGGDHAVLRRDGPERRLIAQVVDIGQAEGAGQNAVVGSGIGADLRRRRGASPGPGSARRER